MTFHFLTTVVINIQKKNHALPPYGTPNPPDISSVMSHMQSLENTKEAGCNDEFIKKKLEEFVAPQNIKETGCDDEFVVCNDAYHGVGDSIRDVNFSCRFSFKSHKDVSQESRMKFLKVLYDSMTDRVNRAYNEKKPI